MTSGRRKKVAKYRKYAYKKNYKNSKKSKRNGNSLLKLARQLGQIERGKSNPNSRVYEAFAKGKAEPKKSVRKPLI